MNNLKMHYVNPTSRRSTVFTVEPFSRYALLGSVIIVGGTIGYMTARDVSLVVAIGMLILASVVSTKGLAWFLTLAPIAMILWVPIVQIGGQYNVSPLSIIMGFIYIGVFIRSLSYSGSTSLAIWSLVPWAYAPAFLGSMGAAVAGVADTIVNGFMIYSIRFALYSIFPVAFRLCPQKCLNRTESLLLAALTGSLVFAFIPSGTTSPFGNRAVALFYNPNVMGNMSVITLNWVVGRLIGHEHETTSSRTASWIALGVAGTALLASGSRSGLVAAIVSLFAWGYFVIRTRKRTIVKRVFQVMALVLASLSVTMISTSMPMIDRVNEVLQYGVNTPNVAGRLEASAIGVKVAALHPLGIGIGNIPEFTEEYSVLLHNLVRVATTDNQFLDVLIETGPLGLLLFISLLLAILVRSLRTEKPQGYAVAINIIVMSISGLAAFTFYNPFISATIWMMTGLTIARYSKKMAISNVNYKP